MTFKKHQFSCGFRAVSPLCETHYNGDGRGALEEAMPHGSDLEKDVPPPALDAGLAAETAAVLDEIAGPGRAIDFLTRNRDFHIRLSSSGPRHVAEHMHENIQISIPLGSTLASVAWRTA